MSEKVSKKRKVVRSLNAAATIAVTIGVAVALNAVSSQLFYRLDLTENKIYTLSASSVSAVQALQEPVHVKAFLSPDLPPPVHNLPQLVSDTLEEYLVAANGKFTYEIVSPDDGDDIEEDARGFGCERVPLGTQSEDEVSLRAVYKCIAFSQGDELQVIKDVQPRQARSLADFEYQFTKALLNLEDTEPHKIGFVTGFGGPASTSQFMGWIESVFDTLYGGLVEETSVDLSGEQPKIPQDLSALVILNATDVFTPQAKLAVDQFIQRGGSVGWYQSATTRDKQLERQLRRGSQRRQPPIARRPIDPGLNELFEAYGIGHRQDMLIDRKQGVTSLTWTQRGPVPITQPGTFVMSDLDQTLPFTRNLSALAMPLPSSLQLQPWVFSREGIKAHRVIETAETAVRRMRPTGTFRYEDIIAEAPDEETGKFVVAAAVEGDVPSFYTEQSLPDGASKKDLVEDSSPSRIFVVGSAHFFNPMPEVGFSEHFATLGARFFVGSLEWLAQDASLTQIRSKAMPRLMGDIPDHKKRSIQLINIALVPIAFALVGLAMMVRRRLRRKALKQTR